MNAYDPFKRDDLTTKREQLAALEKRVEILQRDLSDALRYIQGMHEALDAVFEKNHFFFESPRRFICDGYLMDDVYNVWKLTTTKYPRQPDVIALLWDAHEALHARFNIARAQPVTALHLLTEEYGELLDAALNEVGGASYDEHVTSEAADLLTCTLAVISSLGIEREQFYEACRRVARKNDAKTTDTHYLNEDTGKITRKG